MVGGPYDGQQFDAPYDRDTPPPSFALPQPSMSAAVFTETDTIPNDMPPPLAQYRFLAAVPDKFHAVVLALYAHVDPSYDGPPPEVIGTGLNEWQQKTLDVMAKRNGKIVVLMPKETRKAIEPLGWRQRGVDADEVTIYTAYVLGEDHESTTVIANRHVIAGWIEMTMEQPERDRFREHREEQTLMELAHTIFRTVKL